MHTWGFKANRLKPQHLSAETSRGQTSAGEDLEFARPSGGRIAASRARARTHARNEADFPFTGATFFPLNSDIYIYIYILVRTRAYPCSCSGGTEWRDAGHRGAETVWPHRVHERLLRASSQVQWPRAITRKCNLTPLPRRGGGMVRTGARRCSA